MVSDCTTQVSSSDLTHENRHFVASEWLQGDSLSTLISKRAQSGAPLSVRGAYNVVAHICKALAQVHPTTCHGALRPSVRSEERRVGKEGRAGWKPW